MTFQSLYSSRYVYNLKTVNLNCKIKGCNGIVVCLTNNLLICHIMITHNFIVWVIYFLIQNIQ